MTLTEYCRWIVANGYVDHWYNFTDEEWKKIIKSETT